MIQKFETGGGVANRKYPGLGRNIGLEDSGNRRRRNRRYEWGMNDTQGMGGGHWRGS